MTPMDTRADTPMPLRIARITHAAQGIRSFDLLPPPRAPRANPPRPRRIARITGVARAIRSFDLVPADGAPLPPFTPGSHVRVQTPDGALRKYSLCNDAAERHR